jgi:hypothetical protein
MAKQTVDKYCQRAFATVTQSAIDTLTFEQVRFAVGLYQGVALKIHQVHYYPDVATCRQLVNVNDMLEVGLTTTNKISSLDPMDQAVLGLKRLVGVSTHTELVHNPLVIDFSNLPEGGILVPANPVYIALSSAGFASVGLCRAVVYLSFVSLTDTEYLEVLQTMLPSNI